MKPDSGSSDNAHSKTGRSRNVICMLAYTRYTYDGRVRLEAESLVEWGHRVHFIVPKEGETARTYFSNGVLVQELNVIEYGGKSKLYYCFCYAMFLIRAFVTCSLLALREHVEVVHVHNMPNILVFSALFPRLLGCKIVLDVHDTMVETYQAKFGRPSALLLWLLRCEERLCCFIAYRVICVNHIQREVLLARGIAAEKIITVITMPKFISLPRSVDYGPDPSFKMVNHGTMSWRLGNDLIIKAVARLVHEIPGFELHIIGGGDNLQEMVKLSASLGVSHYVHFHRSVPWHELAAKLAAMDVGIVANRVSSATELMLPLKLIDYVILGIPAIVPKLRTIQHYFTDEMVSYFEPEDIESIVAATLRLYREAPRRARQAQTARSFVAQYGWDSSHNELRSLYERLCPTTIAGAAACGISG
jgi:glycosyltransferase involved in cell wall biosynthesis